MEKFFQDRDKLAIWLAYAQGVFYFVTGIWPILDIESFMMVTGPKNDLWLVRTVGAMIICTAVILLFAALTKEITRSIALLAVLNALALTIVDIVYVSLDVISPIYLLDAAVESLIIFSWLVLWPAPRTVQAPQQPLNRFDRIGWNRPTESAGRPTS